jgi:Ca2+-binding RTX toxin-like protein
VNGGGGNDTLTGGANNDTVNGGAGDDRMVISAQAEIVAGESYNGGSGFDTLDLETVAAINIASLSINANVERLESGGTVSLTAAQLNAFNTVQTGAITLTTTGTVNFSGDTVFTTTFNLDDAGNTLNLFGVTNQNYTVNGGAAADTITGGDNADTLVGGSGNDTLNGSYGNDTLTGGGGQDSYLFSTDLDTGLFNNSDFITDFSVVNDTILLSQSVFAAAGAIGVLAGGAFRTGAAAGDAGDRIIYNNVNGVVLYDPDGSGATAATQFATLSAGLAVTNNDFQIVA